MFSLEVDPELIAYLPILDNKYRIVETLGEGRFAK